MHEHKKAKKIFLAQLKSLADNLGDMISRNDEWTIRGFIDIFQNIYSLSNDTKVISKILELHLLPEFLSFAEKFGYDLELAKYQNWYPDFTFIDRNRHNIKFAVDLKTTYRNKKHIDFCNGFTLGSHGEYFINRNSTKNIQYPYNDYSGHFCLGIIYSRIPISIMSEVSKYSIDDVPNIPAVIKELKFFVEEKWKIASDKGGSGNTANIGSIKHIDDILSGNGVFAIAGEKYFDDYWANFGKLEIQNDAGEYKKLRLLA